MSPIEKTGIPRKVFVISKIFISIFPKKIGFIETKIIKSIHIPTSSSLFLAIHPPFFAAG